jgi:hypothetical protein
LTQNNEEADMSRNFSSESAKTEIILVVTVQVVSHRGSEPSTETTPVTNTIDAEENNFSKMERRRKIEHKTVAANHVKTTGCHVRSREGGIFLDGKATLKPLT